MQNSKVRALIIFIILLWMQQYVRAQEDVAYGIFFYSPTCPHCQRVIQNDWPSIEAEFGDQIDILFINASTAQGNAIMDSARVALQIESNGVPMLILGSEVLVGAIDIPARAPDVIRAGLAAGGIGLPAIPGIQALYDSVNTPRQSADGSATARTTPDEETTLAAEIVPTTSLFDRLAADPIANGLAGAILVLLVVSLFLAALSLRRSVSQPQTIDKLRQGVLLIALLIGLLMTLSLLAGSDGQPVVIAIAAGVLIIFSVLLFTARQASAMHWRIPLTSLAGLAVAAYLASIEITQSEAVCGLVGNCNLVQQSPYAQIAGISIGVIGVVGYLMILLVWAVNRLSKGSIDVEWVLRAAALFGVVFSVYLTFLELFVIGAVCLWCLTSAVIMLVLLALMLPVTDSAPSPQFAVQT